MFQNYALFPYMTVFDNVAYGLKVRKEDKKVIEKRVKELLELVDLKGLEKRYPTQLSGGQRQRVTKILVIPIFPIISFNQLRSSFLTLALKKESWLPC